MAKWRMVPEDHEEAQFIADLIVAHNSTALMDAINAGNIKLLHTLTERELRWKTTAAELREEFEAAQQPAPAEQPVQQPTPRKRAPRQNEGGDAGPEKA